MRQRTKNTVVFGSLMALAIGIYLWAYPLDRGTVSIEVGLPGYWVFAFDKTVECPTDPCVVTLKSGSHGLKIQKDGYFPEETTISVKRFRTVTLPIRLKKIPTLKDSIVVPADKAALQAKPLPEGLDSASVRAFSWDAKGEKLAFLDKGDEKVKIWSNGETKVVTPLTSIGNGLKFIWDPGSAKLAGVVNGELYLIDTQKTSRKKAVLDFLPLNPLWLPKGDGLLVNDDQGKVYKIGVQGEKPDLLSFETDLGHAVWDSDGKLVCYLVDEKENLTKVFAFDPGTGERTEIVSKYDFPVSKIAQDANGAIYFFSSESENWSMLEY